MIILKAAYTVVNPTKNHQNLEPNDILYVFGAESCKFYWDVPTLLHELIEWLYNDKNFMYVFSGPVHS